MRNLCLFFLNYGIQVCFHFFCFQGLNDCVQNKYFLKEHYCCPLLHVCYYFLGSILV